MEYKDGRCVYNAQLSDDWTPEEGGCFGLICASTFTRFNDGYYYEYRSCTVKKQNNGVCETVNLSPLTDGDEVEEKCGVSASSLKRQGGPCAPECKVTSIRIVSPNDASGDFTDNPKYAREGRGRLTAVFTQGGEECRWNTRQIQNTGFELHNGGDVTFNVNFRCGKFNIRDGSEVDTFTWETNSGDAVKFMYMTITLSNEASFTVTDNGKTWFQIPSLNPDSPQDGVTSKTYYL